MNILFMITKKPILNVTLKALLPTAALCASMLTHAAIVTYTFSSTVDNIEPKKLDDPDSFGFTILSLTLFMAASR